MKQGILVAAFGSSQPQAHLANRRFDERLRQAFPGLPVRWAFTSGVIRRRLSGEGIKTDSVTKALKKMAFEQFTQVAVCSLLLIPGAEFEGLKADARVLTEENLGLTRIAVSAPLLSSDADLQDAARAMASYLPQDHHPDDAVVFMGHGTWHAGDQWYDRLMRVVQELTPHVHLATMEGATGIGELIPKLVAGGVRRVRLAPFLAVAGAHVLRDMAGDQPESWLSRLQAAGIACTPILDGVAEHDGFATIWLRHLQEAVAELQT